MYNSKLPQTYMNLLIWHITRSKTNRMAVYWPLVTQSGVVGYSSGPVMYPVPVIGENKGLFAFFRARMVAAGPFGFH